MADLAGRVERLERLVEGRLEKLDSHERTLSASRERIESIGQQLGDLDASASTSGERALRCGMGTAGLLGLLGLGTTAGGASSAGQVGTEERPLEAVHTAALDGPVVGGEKPLTEITARPRGDTAPVRDDSGALRVSGATGDRQTVARGQDVDWPGHHDFDSIPTVETNPVVEEDSNSDGVWTRWADGTQLCWSDTVSEHDVTSRAENVLWDLPAEFATTSYYSDIMLDFDSMSRNDCRSNVNTRPSLLQTDRAGSTVIQNTGDSFTDDEWTDLSGWALGRWK